MLTRPPPSGLTSLNRRGAGPGIITVRIRRRQLCLVLLDRRDPGPASGALPAGRIVPSCPLRTVSPPPLRRHCRRSTRGVRPNGRCSGRRSGPCWPSSRSAPPADRWRYASHHTGLSSAFRVLDTPGETRQTWSRWPRTPGWRWPPDESVGPRRLPTVESRSAASVRTSPHICPSSCPNVRVIVTLSREMATICIHGDSRTLSGDDSGPGRGVWIRPVIPARPVQTSMRER